MRIDFYIYQKSFSCIYNGVIDIFVENSVGIDRVVFSQAAYKYFVKTLFWAQ